jgi:P-type Ca2+ transporter type 2C
VIVATVAIVQEWQSEASLASLTRLVPYHATAVRGGIAATLPAADLVTGDLVRLRIGDRVPADLRLVEVWGACSKTMLPLLLLLC